MSEDDIIFLILYMMGLLLLFIVPNFFFTIAFLLDADTLNMANSSFLLSRRNNSIFNGADLFYESSELGIADYLFVCDPIF